MSLKIELDDRTHRAADAVLASYIDAADELLEKENYTAFVSTSMSAWVSFVQNAPGNDGANPTFDPKATGPHNDAIWVGVLRGPDIVSVFAVRKFHAPSGYYELVRDGRLWSKSPHDPIDILIDDAGPTGIVAHSGGHWVHPDYRGLGLSWLVPRYGQAISQRLWGQCFTGSVLMSGIRSAGLAENYGAQAVRPLIDGYFRPKNRNMQVFSAEYPAGHLVDRARNDRWLIVNNANKKMRDFAPLVRKRKNQPPIIHAAAVQRIVNVG